MVDERTRFWEKVDKRGPEECWPWLAGTHKGYGTFREEGARIGWKAQAQRVAWRLTNGPVPDGHDIDHLCYNPLCCNPKHLEPVAHSENMRRMWARRRALLGDEAGMAWGVKTKTRRYGSAARYAKFTKEQANAVRADKRTAQVIAAEYGVSVTTVYHLRQGIHYRLDGVHVRGSVQE
jgi:hypothetical protein